MTLHKEWEDDSNLSIGIILIVFWYAFEVGQIELL